LSVAHITCIDSFCLTHTFSPDKPLGGSGLFAGRN